MVLLEIFIMCGIKIKMWYLNKEWWIYNVLYGNFFYLFILCNNNLNE